MDSEKATCADCGAEFASKAVGFEGVIMFRQRYCATCMTKSEEREKASKTRSVLSERAAEWTRICPASYQGTDIEHSGISDICRRAAKAWNPESVRGLAFIGVTGLGKTRSLFWVLQRAHDAGRSCAAISHNRFSRVVADAFAGDGDERARGKALLRKLARVDVLLFDDLGKAPSTERADAECEELVEVRTSNGLPMLWTSNGSGAWLAKRFGEDRGEPITRRLGEFCRVITV